MIGGDALIDSTELDTNAAATALQVSARQVRNFVASGELKPDRVVKTAKRTFYYFQPATVDALVRRRRGEDAPIVEGMLGGAASS